jgi:predicted house-cleaning noncanonical NTP pyrophosphatase (MazG superfamily)
MPRVTYNKLVRDLIPERIEKSGEHARVRVLTTAEFSDELRKKLLEEAAELTQAHTRDDVLKEYADLMVVLDFIALEHEFSKADIHDALTRNLEAKGSFEKRFFLEYTE